jgi:hypothetical protein
MSTHPGRRRSFVLGLVAALAIGSVGVATPPAANAARPTTVAAAKPQAVAVKPQAIAAQPTTEALTASAIVPGSVNRTSPRVSAEYRARMALGYGVRAVSVDSTATITNTSGGPIDRIEFNSAAGPLGGMTIRGAWVDGRVVTARRTDQTIIVPLGGILPEGDTVAVRVQYSAKLRTSLSGSSWLFTKANGIANLYRWLPWVSRETPFARPNHGDPFVTASSPYVRVTIRTDRKLVIASTGDRTSVSADGLIQTFEARNVRDFTVTAAPDFRTRSVQVGDTTVRTYYRSGANASLILDSAVDAFTSMQSRLGDYPHPTFKVVQSAGGYGMESPGLIWIPYGIGSANLRYLVTHETAHQWFYGIVGNDQARQPFADEAAADFMARYTLDLRRASRCSTARLDRMIYHYTSGCYYEIIYIQGGNLLDDARRRMGSSVFWNALKGYVGANRYGLVSNITLLEALDSATSLDLEAIMFRTRFPSHY